MGESTLTLTYDDLLDGVYEQVFGGDGDYSAAVSSSLIDTAQQNLVKRMIESGLRQWYRPTGPAGAHEWSFLRPVRSLSLNASYATGTVTVVSGVVTLASGTWPSWAADGMFDVGGNDYSINTRDSDTQITLDDTSTNADSAALTTYKLRQDDYDLPDDFASLLGPFTFSQADNAWVTIEIVGEARIRELRQRSNTTGSSTGDPQYGAIRTKPIDGYGGTRHEVILWPGVIASATLTYQSRLRPSMLINPLDVPYGASDYSEAILYSCLAEAERRMDGGRGEAWQNYQELLQSAIADDSRINKPNIIGYNANWSEGRAFSGQRRDFLWGDGVGYSGTGTQSPSY